MASRLSEESLKAVYDTGHQGLAIQSEQALDLLSAPSVDLDKLLLEEDPQAAVQAVPPQALYQALMLKGPEDALDVLEHMSADQVVRIFDYDIWTDDRLAPHKAIRWLNLFKEIGPEQLYTRFKELDEEYQLALLGPEITTYDEEEYEKLSDAEQDSLGRMPCNTVFYKVTSQDPRMEEFISGLLEATMGSDINYAYALLAHAYHLPPNEQEEQIARFRKARLEEDGFVTFEESRALFRPLELDAMKQKWSFLLARDAIGLSPSKSRTTAFLLTALQAGARKWTSEEFERVSRGFATLGNMLAAAARVETDDLEGLRRLMQQAQALAGLGLEWLSGSDENVAVALLEKETPQMLFRTGISLVSRLTDAVTTELKRHGVTEADNIERNLRMDKRGVVIHMIETALLEPFGFERVETLKGLYNRFPVLPVTMTTDEDGLQRMLFQPITSLVALTQMAATADALTGLLHLSSLAGGPLGKASLDRRLTTGLARVLAGGGFTSEPLSDIEVKRLSSLPREALQTTGADFFAGVEGTLREALAPGGAGWAASRAAKIHVDDPVQAVMTEFSDLIMRLHAVLGSTEAHDDVALVRALRGLADVESKHQEAL